MTNTCVNDTRNQGKNKIDEQTRVRIVNSDGRLVSKGVFGKQKVGAGPHPSSEQNRARMKKRKIRHEFCTEDSREDQGIG